MAKGKALKHPLPPKVPLSAYMEFVKEERPKVLLELGLAPSQVGAAGKELGRRWNALNDEDKKKFKDRSQANWEAFKKENVNLTARKMKKLRKPLSPFLLFAKEERPKVVVELGVLTVGDMGKELGRRWRQLPSEEKINYESKSKEDRRKYERDVEELTQSESPEAIISETISQQPSGGGGDGATETCEDDILPGDLGFAKQRFHTWYPALRTGTLSRGTRVKVTYFGTAETGTVDRKQWLP